MKRFFAVALFISLLLAIMPGCLDKSEYLPPEGNDIPELVEEYDRLLALIRDAEAAGTPDDVVNYIINWSINNDFTSYRDKYGNVALTARPSEGYEDEPSTILQCSLSLSDPEARARSIATALYTLKNADNHGQIRALFTENGDGQMDGAKKIYGNYLKSDRLINLDWDGSGSILNAGAGISDFMLTRQLRWVEPTCSRAYEISIQGLSGSDVSDFDGTELNPIISIGELLAGAKSGGILFELASINGGISHETPPASTTAVILINDNDVNSFTKRFNSARDRLINKYSKSHPEITYTLTETPLPDKVVSAEDCTSIISLLYTMFNGTYQKSGDKEILAVSNLGSISTYTGNFIVSVREKSTSGEILAELATRLETICGLCSISYSLTETVPVWNQDSDSLIVTELSESIESVSGAPVKIVGTLKQTECSIFYMRNNELDIVSIGVDQENIILTSTALLDFLNAGNKILLEQQ